MKLDKNLLKSIVKECLVEILAEGIVNTSSTSSGRKKRALSEAIVSSGRSRSIEGAGNLNQNTQSTHTEKRRSYLDNISFGGENNRNERHENAVSKITKSITKDAVMQDILADTARTTLQEQRNDTGSRHAAPIVDSRPADRAAEIVSKTEPDELFGESAKNWATLAFS